MGLGFVGQVCGRFKFKVGCEQVCAGCMVGGWVFGCGFMIGLGLV